jgi:hypothetical protein
VLIERRGLRPDLYLRSDGDERDMAAAVSSIDLEGLIEYHEKQSVVLELSA